MTSETPLKRRAGASLWRQIADQIEQDIRDQVLRPGDKLPTEWDLTARFGVNRHTVRRALAALAETGVVRAEQGRGTFVQEGLIEYPIARKTRFSAVIRAQDRDPEGELLRAQQERSNNNIADALGIPVGEMVTKLTVVRRADGHALSLSEHIFEQRRFPAIAEVFRKSGSLTQTMAEFGVGDFSRQRTIISARLPTPEETRLLQVPKTRPMLVTEAIDTCELGLPLSFNISGFPADRVKLATVS